MLRFFKKDAATPAERREVAAAEILLACDRSSEKKAKNRSKSTI